MAVLNTLINKTLKPKLNTMIGSPKTSPTLSTYSTTATPTTSTTGTDFSSIKAALSEAKKTVNPYREALTTTTTAPATDTTTTPAFDQAAYLKTAQDNVNSLYDAQKTAQLSALKTQRDQAVGQINQQITDTGTEYQGKRNQADVVNAQNVQKLREMMAAQGLSSSGENVTANVAQNNARLNSLNDLNLQEQSTVNDYKRRIADLSNGADDQNVINQLEAQRAQALMDAGYRADDTGFRNKEFDLNKAVSEAGLTGMYNGQQTLGGKELDFNKAVQEAGLTGIYNGHATYQAGQDAKNNAFTEAGITGKFNGKDTMAAIDSNRNFDLNQAGVTGKYNGKTTWQAIQDTIHNKQIDDAAKAQAIQQSKDNKWREKTYNTMSASEKAQLAQNIKIHGEDLAWEDVQMRYQGQITKSTNQATINAYTNP